MMIRAVLKNYCGWSVQVGHSMGAALAVWAANTGGMKTGLDGVIAIDVVEGTALGEFDSARGC
jgi:pimeloyl-ACP methyl ester carboxylesterase